MNKILLSLFSIALSSTLFAQDNLGINTGNYSGITGIALQPANVADNRYQFDMNLISASVNFDNNYLGFSRNYFLNNRFSFKDFNSYDEFKSKVLVENNLNGNKAYFNLNNRMQAPLSFLLTTGKKSGIALNIQSRTSIAIKDVNADFAKQVYEFWKYQPTQGQTYDASGMKINALNWLEVGLTYGRVLLDQDKHFLKFGITGKYLGGISSWNMDAKSLSVVDTKDSFLTASGNVNYNHSNSDISTKINSSYRPDASSWGGDIGLVYEFRGRIDKFKFLKYNKNTEEVVSKERRDKNKYTFKVGVSLLDVGVLKFTSAPLARNFSINTNNFNMWALDVRNVKQFDTLISNNVTYTGAVNEKYSVAMPTALSAQVDWHLLKGFYVNAMAYMPFNSLNKNTTYRIQSPNYFAVTPRWESRMAGLYVPFVVNSKKEISAGATLRVGPLFIGTSNLLTLIKKDNIQNADLHAGIKIPLAFGKPSKASKWLKKFTNDDDKTSSVTEKNNVIEEKTIQNTEDGKKIEEIKTIIKEDKLPAQPQPIQIIINNYNSSSSLKRNAEGIINTSNDSLNNYSNQYRNSYSTTVLDSNNIKVTENNIDVQELNDLQQQIDYLKNKITQKENLIKELEKTQNDVNGNSNLLDSKKKIIDSLQQLYVTNNLNQRSSYINDTYYNSLTKKQKLNYLANELNTLQNKNTLVDEKIVVQSKKIDSSIVANSNNQKKVEQLQVLKGEYLTLQNSAPLKLNSTTTNSSSKKNSGGNTLYPTVIQQNVDVSNLVTQKDAETFMTKKEYNVLLNEIESLKKEIKEARNTQLVATGASYIGNTGRRRRDKVRNIYNTTNVAPTDSVQSVKIIRDTIYVEKTVDRVVEKIVRDTITNTIEKNNTITKTETKEIEVDNGRKNALELAPEIVLFDVNQYMIKPIYFSKLTFFADKVKKYNDLKIHISGHTDNTGNIEKNKILSVNRAKAVRAYLLKRGVKSENIIIDAEGAANPIAENNTASGKSQNRRVEVSIMEN